MKFFKISAKRLFSEYWKTGLYREIGNCSRSFVGFGDPLFTPDQKRKTKVPVQGAEVASRGLLSVRGLPVHLRATPNFEEKSSVSLAQLPQLPDTADEVRSIAVALAADLTRDVFTGSAASEKQVKTMALSVYRVLAFATHGLVPADLDGLTVSV